MKRHLYTICFSAALIAFTLYISLDTFVLKAAYDTGAAAMNTEMFSEEYSVTSEESFSQLPETPENEGSSDIAVEDKPDTKDAGSSAKKRPDSGDTERPERPTKLPEGFMSRKPSDGNFPFDGDHPSRKPDGQSEPTAEGSQNEQQPEIPADASDTSGTSGAVTAADPSPVGSYANGEYSITLTEYYEYGTHIYVADITVASAQFLKTAFADDTYGKNITGRTSGIAQTKNAILAINGDYYGVRESGYVIRNGIVYRDAPAGVQILCVKADGTMSIVNDSDYTAQQLVEDGVWQAFSFGPALVSGSSVTVSKNDEVRGELNSNPRTAIGMIDANHYVFVVSDGRTEESEGLSLYELASFMRGLGAKTAYNLDGGGSSTMYFNGQVINKPTTNGVDIKERGISDIVYIG